MLSLLFLVAGASAWTGCSLGVNVVHTYQNGHLLTSYSISGGSIGGTMVETAQIAASFNDGIRTVLPDTWSDTQYDANTSTIAAFAGCETHVLTDSYPILPLMPICADVVRSASVSVPFISIDGLTDLMGGSAAWSVGAQRMFPGSRSWQQFLLRREGSVVATGCTLHTCVFAGMLAGHSVDVILSLSTAGVGVPAALEDVCGELSVHNNTDMRFEACSDTRVCRGILCVQQTYVHGIANISGLARPVDVNRLVVLGLDTLDTEERNIMVYFSAEELRLGVLYMSRWSSWGVFDHLFIVITISAMAAVFIQRPLVIELDKPEQQRRLVHLNLAGTTTLVVFMFYRIVDIRDGIARSTGYDTFQVDALMFLAAGVTLIQYLLCVYANLVYRAASPRRNAIIRQMFASMLCTAFIMHNCGATEHDVQVLLAAVGALAWLHTVPRMLCVTYITYGTVWVFTYGLLLQLALLPFIVPCGLVTAMGTIDVIETSNTAVALAVSILSMLAGIYAAVSASDAIPVERGKQQ